MSALAHSSWTDNLHVMDAPYRLSSWALDDPENIGLWVDENEQLVAWAVMQTPMWVIDVACLPTVEAASIYSQLLAWADARARDIASTPDGQSMWFVNVRDNQKERIRALEETGFTCQSNARTNPWRKVFLAGSAQPSEVARSIPEGINIRPLAGQNEVDAYVELHRCAFGGQNMTREWRRRVLQCPAYVPDLDLVAVAPNGTLAAFCVAWFAAKGLEGRPCGQIEPMGVHPDYQRQGIGQAILSEVEQRLHRYGAERIYVEADENGGTLDFYRSAGFQVAFRVLVYRKDYR